MLAKEIESTILEAATRPPMDRNMNPPTDRQAYLTWLYNRALYHSVKGGLPESCHCWLTAANKAFNLNRAIPEFQDD